MKTSLLTLVLISMLFVQSNAQDTEPGGRSCSVVCLNGQWIPTSYEANSKSSIQLNSNGVISVHETFDVADRANYNNDEFIDFKVAIYKKEAGSLVSFSDKTYQKIDAREILDKCAKGDQIVILLTNPDKYSLPHYQIEVL